MPVDIARLEAAVRELLVAAGEDPQRDGLLETPRRVAALYAELFAGIGEDPGEHLAVRFAESHSEMVMVRDISFASLCEQHLIPFVGQAHLAYIPNEDGRITGLSKLARVVEGFARRPQVQERMTTQIADSLEEGLKPQGTLVVLEAEHLCMSIRGVRKPGARTITSAVRGRFLTDARTRIEAMELLHRS